MLRRRSVFKVYKTVCILVLYYVLYTLFMFAITPDSPATFVSKELQVGSKYVLMFLVAPPEPVFSDVDGADVFASRRCGSCFITNNKGFLPISSYDAILVYGKKSLLYETQAAMEPNKRYLIESTAKCYKSKFQDCSEEPIVTSFYTKESYTLCSLCKHMLMDKNTSASRFTMYQKT